MFKLEMLRNEIGRTAGAGNLDPPEAELSEADALRPARAGRRFRYGIR